MGEPKRKLQAESPAPEEVEEQRTDRGVYPYKHAGLSERSGEVPFWLIVVVLSLLFWGVYYTVEYWSGG